VTVDDRYLGVSNSGFQFAKRIPLAEYDAVVVPGRLLVVVTSDRLGKEGR
jgi:hypothetical protein